MSESVKDLPRGWEWSKLGNISPKITDGTHITPRYCEFGIPFISVKDIYNKKISFDKCRFISIEEHELLKKRCFPEYGDVLITKSGTIGRTAIIKTKDEFSLFVSVALIKINNSIINSNYVGYSLENFITTLDIKQDVKGGVIKNLHIEDIKELKIKIPPLNEQHRIVAKIEELFTQLDAGIASLHAVQVRLGQYRKAVLKHAFEGKLTEAWRQSHQHEIEPASVLLDRIREEWRKDKKYKELPPVETEGLSEIPERWVWTTLENLNPPSRTCAYGVLQPGDNVEGGIPMVRVGDIGDGHFYHTDLKKINPEISSKYSRTILQGGEVLITLVGAIGRTTVVPNYHNGANTARAVGVIPISNHVNPHFIEMWIRNPTNNIVLSSKAHEVARKTLNLEDVRVFTVALAPKSEQDIIVSEIQQKFSLIDSIDKILASSYLQTDSLRQSILKKAFEGRLVPQDPNDEPASVLLDRIRQEKPTAEPKKRRVKRNAP